MLVEIEETIVVQANEACTLLGDKNNSFNRVLNYAEELKVYELTPMYLLNEETMELFVVAKELYNKKIN